jgi:hypothetical protein
METFKQSMAGFFRSAPVLTAASQFRRLPFFLAILIVACGAAESRASYPATVLADTPAAYWRLGETAGNVAFDSSENGRNATYAGPKLGQPGALVGDNNAAVLFNAYEKDAIQCADSTGLVPGLDSWAVEAWVKVGWSGRDMEIVSWYPGAYEIGHDSYYKLAISNEGAPRYSVRDVNGYSIDLLAPTLVADDAWHHLVGAIDRPGSKLRLYVDGAQVASAPLGSLGLIYDREIPLNIGLQQRFWTSDSKPLEGKVDEVALYRRALSNDQVLLHYQVGRGLLNDSDQDGVFDVADSCPDTPPGVTVDASGCQLVAQCSAEQIELAVQNAVAAKDAIIAEKDALLAQKDSTISSLNADVNSLLAAVAAKDEAISALNAKTASMYTKEQLDAAVQQAEAAKDAVIQEKELAVAALSATVAELQKVVATKDGLIGKMQQDLLVNITALNAAVTARDQKISDLNASIDKLYSQAQLEKAAADASAAAQQSVMRKISANLGLTFGIAGYIIPGSTVDGQVANLTRAIDSLPKGQTDKLEQMLAPLP